ncbi:hypothetical protein SAMN05192559_102259 [Halobacillus karajensis]|uniref:YceG-like family protein n=1 Tax=Halobacillus karajensis TaxID=195088 RepID=A0A024P6E4_9BACI|nr:hypothetical protein [Halobacillus karajensis]CDQ18004.1 YceG-like family protein [Halobacillus karajensis]CDQ24353.1 YceG-like family protein [Halobacillus karajensis]CDQ29398.1 YceG-like family protein [Halobacillus karajensis]SEH61124.1 hypothetical protein SAMN05192559_102259 [Halobacillus karajensis]
MKPWIRSYALGLFTAALVFAITYWNTGAPGPEVVEKKYEVEEMITHLEQEGYRAVTNEEWNAVQSSSRERENIEPTVNPTTTFSLDIIPGTTTDTISKKLVRANIIENADEFKAFMEKNDYSRYIQIGQTTLHSGMSHEEIAETITSK